MLIPPWLILIGVCPLLVAIQTTFGGDTFLFMGRVLLRSWVNMTWTLRVRKRLQSETPAGYSEQFAARGPGVHPKGQLHPHIRVPWKIYLAVFVYLFLWGGVPCLCVYWETERKTTMSRDASKTTRMAFLSSGPVERYHVCEREGN